MDDRSFIRADALQKLANLGLPAAPYLATALRDEDPEVRRFAVAARGALVRGGVSRD